MNISKNKIVLTVWVTILMFLALLGLYLFRFNAGLSQDHLSWGSFGSYFAGTIGVCFSFLSVLFMYLTFYEQRKLKFENSFQQYITNYFTLLNLINENWLHSENPKYLSGREIFGRAIGLISEHKEEKSFRENFKVHINVYHHHCYYLVGLFEFVNENSELSQNDRNTYINRFFSIVSTYEKVFFAYFVRYYLESNHQNINQIEKSILSKMDELEKLGEIVPHFKQIKFITNELNKVLQLKESKNVTDS